MDYSTREKMSVHMTIREGEIYRRIEEYKRYVMNEKSTEGGVTRAKGQLILDILRDLPFEAIDCAYCQGYSCSGCPFGKVQGRCGEDDSKYREVLEARLMLMEAVSRCYSTFKEGN